MTTLDQELLLRAISLSPEENTPRLAYADLVEETATTDAQRAYAEFIRVSLEPHVPGRWERNDNGTQRFVPRRDELRDRWESSWRCPPCQSCVGSGKLKTVIRSTRLEEGLGFVSGYGSIPCPTCGGTGFVGPLSEDIPPVRHGGKPQWEHKVQWVRGFPVVEVDFKDIGLSKSGEPSWIFHPEWMFWAIRCVKEHGVSFHVTGRDAGPESEKWWSKHLNGEPVLLENRKWWLPNVIFDELDGWYTPPGYMSQSLNRHYLTLPETVQALDRAVTKLVVKRAYPEDQK